MFHLFGFLGYTRQEHLQAFTDGAQPEIFRVDVFQRKEEDFRRIVHCFEMQGIGYRTAEKQVQRMHGKSRIDIDVR